jgi:hypothetical protein
MAVHDTIIGRRFVETKHRGWQWVSADPTCGRTINANCGMKNISECSVHRDTRVAEAWRKQIEQME